MRLMNNRVAGPPETSPVENLKVALLCLDEKEAMKTLGEFPGRLDGEGRVVCSRKRFGLEGPLASWLVGLPGFTYPYITVND
jgi:hypothetical protein